MTPTQGRLATNIPMHARFPIPRRLIVDLIQNRADRAVSEQSKREIKVTPILLRLYLESGA